MLKNLHCSLPISLTVLGTWISSTVPSAQEREIFLPALSELDYPASTDLEAAIAQIKLDLAKILSGPAPDHQGCRPCQAA